MRALLAAALLRLAVAAHTADGIPTWIAPIVGICPWHLVLTA